MGICMYQIHTDCWMLHFVTMYFTVRKVQKHSNNSIQKPCMLREGTQARTRTVGSLLTKWEWLMSLQRAPEVKYRSFTTAIHSCQTHTCTVLCRGCLTCKSNLTLFLSAWDSGLYSLWQCVFIVSSAATGHLHVRILDQWVSLNGLTQHSVQN